MARILFMTSKEKGHLNPVLPVAMQLQERGHHVGWRCLPHATDRLDQMGIDTSASPPREGAGEEELETGGPELARLVRDDERLLQWIRTLLVDQVPEQIEPNRQVLRQWRPDVLVVDPMLYGGIIAAHLEGIPYVCISSSLNPVTPDDLDCRHTHNMRALDADRKALFARYEMSPRFKVADCLSPHLNMVLATREYLGADVEVPPATHLVGPTQPMGRRGDEVEFPWHKLDGRPVIYASFGSQISHQPERFEAIAQASESLDVQLVISCGELADAPWADSLPAHVIAVPYTPQRQLLERVQVMITHGGANSVMEALVAGVPMVISPVCNDQPMQAYFATRRGVAVELDLDAISHSRLRDELGRLLAGDAPERLAVREVAQQYRGVDGARRAATLIEELLP
jgi:zeaxanthin glucosyltransferase